MRSGFASSYRGVGNSVAGLEFQCQREAGRSLPAAPAPAVDDLPMPQQLALMQMHESQVKRAIVARLMADLPALPSAGDYRALVERGWATRGAADRWHKLTFDGADVARLLERKLCRELNVHLLRETGATTFDVNFQCPCGWAVSIKKGRATSRNGHSAFNRHLATAAGMSGLSNALKPVAAEG